jgi:hypothetical protein
VICSWPDGKSRAVSVTVGKSERDSLAVNAGDVVEELGAQGLGLIKNVGLVQGLMVIIIGFLLSIDTPIVPAAPGGTQGILC